jgi:hypothetical protein
MSKKIDKEREEEDITKVANWILYECDSPEEEVEFLLKLLYTQEANVRGIITIQEAYGDVLEWLSKKEENNNG